MLAIGVQSTQERSAVHIAVPILIIIKVPVLIVQVYVIPDGFQWYIVVAEVVYNILQLSPVRITPTTLMIPESEVLLHRGVANNVHILLGHFRLRRAGEEVPSNVSLRL